jgi:glycosyl-4,4'-diaponeurosporenoate acyltransferase
MSARYWNRSIGSAVQCIDLSAIAIVVINAAVFAAWSVVVSRWAQRRRFTTDGWLSRAWRWERDGACYERLRVRRWKDRLPNVGGAKSAIGDRSTSALDRFVVETRRAEWVHWMIVAIVPLFAAWNPAWAMPLVLLIALAFNLPCIVVQRYNRLRLRRVLLRRAP